MEILEIVLITISVLTGNILLVYFTLLIRKKNTIITEDYRIRLTDKLNDVANRESYKLDKSDMLSKKIDNHEKVITFLSGLIEIEVNNIIMKFVIADKKYNTANVTSDVMNIVNAIIDNTDDSLLQLISDTYGAEFIANYIKSEAYIKLTNAVTIYTSSQSNIENETANQV